MKLNFVTVRIVALMIVSLWLVYLYGAQASIVAKFAHEFISSESFHRNIRNKSDNEDVRFAYHILSYRRDPIAIELASADLAHTNSQIVMLAASYLAECQGISATPSLINLLNHSDSKLQNEALLLLQKITLQNIPNNYQLWKDWWAQQKT